MIYRYDKIKKDYKDYIEKSRINAIKRFGKSLDELLDSQDLTDQEAEFIEYYHKYMPVCTNPSTMNQICLYMESMDDNYKVELNERRLSYEYLKYNFLCHKEIREKVEELFQLYQDKLSLYRKDKHGGNGELAKEKIVFCQYIRDQILQIDKQNEVFNALIDIADRNHMGRQFIWEVYCPELLDRIEEVKEVELYVDYE